MTKSIVDTFWSEHVWLPSDITWDDVTPGYHKDVNYNDRTHLWCALPLTLMLMYLQWALNWLGLTRAGRRFGLSYRHVKPIYTSTVLEAAYQKSNQPDKFLSLAKKSELTEYQLKRWYRLRRSYDEPTVQEFCENVWKLIFYTSNFCFGLYVLWDKPWLWNIDQCFVGHPHHGITRGVWWYYTLSSAFYWSLLVSQTWDRRGKDFRLHAATSLLLFFGWVCNLHRIGAVLLLLHDFSNIFLEYLRATGVIRIQRKPRDYLVLMLAFMCIASRIYPFFILWSTTFRAPTLTPMFPAYYILVTLLWLVFITRTMSMLVIAYRTFRRKMMEYIESGRRQRDSRRKSSFRARTLRFNISTFDDLYLNTKVNEHVDKAISQLLPFMRANKLDPMDLPDVVEGSDFRLRLRDGYMTGLMNVTRSGDQKVKYSDNKLNVQLMFQFTKLEIVYKYLVQVLNIGPSGEIVGSLDRFRIGFDLLFDFNHEKPLRLQEFSISDISDLRVQFTRNYLMDRLVNPLIDLFTNIFHKTIIDAVQSNISAAIQDALEFTNDNLKDIIQSIVLNIVFENSQVTQIIADRYTEWRREHSNKVT